MKNLLYSLILTTTIFSCSSDDEVELQNFIEIKTTEQSFLFTNQSGVFNQYFLGPNQDQLSLVLENSDNFMCEIHFTNSNLLEQQFPYTISNDLDYADAEIQLLNRNVSVEAVFGSEDDTNFVGVASSLEIQFTISSFKDNVVEGTVSGTIRTRTGRTSVIEEGKFRIKVEIVEGS